MPVHVEGNPCEMDRVLAVARKHGLKVIEDCAQSMGAHYKGPPVGAMGDINIFSLQICKTITTGDGGVVTTNDADLFERSARFHDLGLLRPVRGKMLGGAKSRMFPSSQFRVNEFTGSVALAQLRKWMACWKCCGNMPAGSMSESEIYPASAFGPGLMQPATLASACLSSSIR
jgi:8-amino-3,8-dideoxy-alpha-D-manno-octulosonate transaminase